MGTSSKWANSIFFSRSSDYLKWFNDTNYVYYIGLISQMSYKGLKIIRIEDS